MLRSLDSPLYPDGAEIARRVLVNVRIAHDVDLLHDQSHSHHIGGSPAGERELGRGQVKGTGKVL